MSASLAESACPDFLNDITEAARDVMRVKIHPQMTVEQIEAICAKYDAHCVIEDGVACLYPNQSRL